MAEPVENHEALFIEILKSYAEFKNEPADEFVDEDDNFEYWELLKLESFGEFENIELDDDCYWVFKWKGEYYKLCYTYQSYNCLTLYKLYKVEPIVTEPVTFYEPI
jgi:hypothetical protein